MKLLCLPLGTKVDGSEQGSSARVKERSGNGGTALQSIAVACQFTNDIVDDILGNLGRELHPVVRRLSQSVGVEQGRLPALSRESGMTIRIKCSPSSNNAVIHLHATDLTLTGRMSDQRKNKYAKLGMSKKTCLGIRAHINMIVQCRIM